MAPGRAGQVRPAAGRRAAGVSCAGGEGARRPGGPVGGGGEHERGGGRDHVRAGAQEAAQGLGEAGGGVHGRAEDSRAAEVGVFVSLVWGKLYAICYKPVQVIYSLNGVYLKRDVYFKHNIYIYIYISY